jgi:hypothetical protein
MTPVTLEAIARLEHLEKLARRTGLAGNATLILVAVLILWVKVDGLERRLEALESRLVLPGAPAAGPAGSQVPPAVDALQPVVGQRGSTHKILGVPLDVGVPPRLSSVQPRGFHIMRRSPVTRHFRGFNPPDRFNIIVSVTSTLAPRNPHDHFNRQGSAFAGCYRLTFFAPGRAGGPGPCRSARSPALF